MTLHDALAHASQTAPCTIGAVRFIRNGARIEAHHATLGHAATIVPIGNHFEAGYAQFGWNLSGLFGCESQAISEVAGRLNAVPCASIVTMEAA